MTSRLSALLTAVEEALTERCGRLSLRAPVFVRGERSKPATDELPRVTWVRQRCEWSPPVRTASTPNPRLTRETTVQARLIAGTEEDAETLLDQLVLACLDVGLQSVAFGQATWGLVSESSPREEIVLPITFDVPVYDPETTATIETTTWVSGLGTAGDGTLEPDEE